MKSVGLLTPAVLLPSRGQPSVEGQSWTDRNAEVKQSLRLGIYPESGKTRPQTDGFSWRPAVTGTTPKPPKRTLPVVSIVVPFGGYLIGS